jgi:hypothetical protein
MIREGNRVPNMKVFNEARELVSLWDLLADGPMMIFMYLFDWSST